MHKVVYLTGAPACGKSTLCEHLEKVVPDLSIYSYSKLLRDYVNTQRNCAINEIEIRQRSSDLITGKDVKAVDQWLIEEVSSKRSHRNIIIDSHAVTKESYGFRVTAFTTEQLQQLNPDVIICLYISPEITRERIENDAAGRSLPPDFELGLHIHLQASFATQYAFILNKPCYLVNSAFEVEILVKNICDIAKFN